MREKIECRVKWLQKFSRDEFIVWWKIHVWDESWNEKFSDPHLKDEAGDVLHSVITMKRPKPNNELVRRSILYNFSSPSVALSPKALVCLFFTEGVNLWNQVLYTNLFKAESYLKGRERGLHLARAVQQRSSKMRRRPSMIVHQQGPKLKSKSRKALRICWEFLPNFGIIHGHAAFVPSAVRCQSLTQQGQGLNGVFCVCS